MSEAEFEKAVEDVKQLPAQPNDVLLKLYALYKQARQGDVSGPKPSMFDLRAKAKYKAWSELKGMSRDQACLDYVAYVHHLLRK